MGVSWYNKVTFVVTEDETNYLDSLPERLPGINIDKVPVYDKEVGENTITFTSGGYGLFNPTHPDFPLPKSYTGVVTRTQGLQGQEFDVVDGFSSTELDDYRYERDEDGDLVDGDSEPFEPWSEYFTEGNPTFNIYTTQPDVNTIVTEEMEDNEDFDDDEYLDKVVELWEDMKEKIQDKNFNQLVTTFKSCR